MSENKKTIKVLQVKLLNYYYGVIDNSNEFLAGINIENIYSILPAGDNYNALYYYKEVPQCDLCGAGIINGKCFYCDTKENDIGEIKEHE